jgi:NADH dehydrogenase [ubiquinone] 1 alpha subcomplex assembly factor 3
VPSTAIDACLWDGFHLNNGVKITQGAGVLLVGGEAFGWRPWDAGTQGEKAGGKRLLNGKGQWEVDDGAWGLLEVVWPKPGSSFPPWMMWPVHGYFEFHLI